MKGGLSDINIMATRKLDENNIDNFRILVSKTHSLKVLEACINIEKAERRREDYLIILNSRMKELAGF